MILYYIRHGAPIYHPDSLTILGHKQAEAVAKRLVTHRIDRVYASTSNRAKQTAQPTCDLIGKEPILLDFASEHHGWLNLTIATEKGRRWLYEDPEMKRLLSTPEIRQLGEKWYEHPRLKEYHFEKEIERVYDEADKFFAELGFEHIRHTGSYKVVTPNHERVAFFAHQGFGVEFLSCLLDIPYPMFCKHFDISFTGVTVIEFEEEDGYAFPRVMTLSNDSHLYKEGVPLSLNGPLPY